MLLKHDLCAKYLLTKNSHRKGEASSDKILISERKKRDRVKETKTHIEECSTS